MAIIVALWNAYAWALAGVAGGILSVPLQPSLESVQSKLWAAVTGCACAFFLTPPALDYFEIPTAYRPALAFVLGLVGVSLVLVFIRALISFDLSAWLANFFGGGKR